MGKVKNSNTNFFNDNFVFILIIIVISFTCGFIFNFFIKILNNYEGNSNMSNKLTYYYMEGCGHCNNFNPIWDDFTSNYSGPPEITFEKIESANAPSSITGYPTVMLTKSDGSTVEFNAGRTVGELQNFITNQNLS